MNDLAKREWKLMPKEPTAEMLATARMDEGDGSIEATYRALFDAAPEQKPADIVPAHCSGSALAFHPGVLHVYKDGSGYIAVDEDDFILEDDRSEGENGPEGSIHWIVRLQASEVIALRDCLNGNAQSSADLERLKTENDKLQEAVQFVARWAWREDQPNATNKLTDAERLSAIKHHPMIHQHGGRFDG